MSFDCSGTRLRFGFQVLSLICFSICLGFGFSASATTFTSVEAFTSTGASSATTTPVEVSKPPVALPAELAKVFTSAKVQAQNDGTVRITGFVKLTPDKNWFVDYRKAAPGKPTVVLLNGMTYDTTSWNAFVEELRGKGLGILVFDLDGQGQTLDKAGPVSSKIDFSAQVDHTLVLLDRLQLKAPVSVVGLSYGGGMAIQFTAKYPERVANCILMSPYTEPMASQDNLIKFNVSTARMMFPFNPASDDELYDYFLKNLVYTTYPGTEPSILKSSYRLEATFRLAQGSRTFFAADWVRRLPAQKVHLMIAGKDQYIPREVLEKFWASVPLAARATKLVVEGSEHKIPEAEPKFSAAWVRYIVEQNPIFLAKEEMSGNAQTGAAKGKLANGSRIDLY